VSGYIEVGYVIVLGSLATYATSLVGRERAARRRLPSTPADGDAAAAVRPDAAPSAGELP